MRTTFVVAAALALGASGPAVAGTARTFDLVTYTAPDGFTVDASASDHVVVKRVGAKSYCLIGIYGGAAASSDLDASFAAEWADIVNRSVDPVAAPAAQHTTVAGVDTATGLAMTTSGGKPVLVMMTALDAGAKVVSIVVLTPNADDLEVYTPSITALYGSLAVRRVAPPAPADNTPAAPPATAPSSDGPPPPPTKPIALADLAGVWSNDAGAVQGYVHTDGGYAGYSSIQNAEEWTVDAKHALVSSVFTSASSNNSGAHGFTQKRKLHIKIAADGDLELTSADGQYTDEVTHYLIIGWRVTPDATLMVVKGPYYKDGIPDDIFKNPSSNSYMNQTFARVTKSK